MPTRMNADNELVAVRHALVELTNQSPVNASLVECMTHALWVEKLLVKHYGTGTQLQVMMRTSSSSRFFASESSNTPTL